MFDFKYWVFIGYKIWCNPTILCYNFLFSYKKISTYFLITFKIVSIIFDLKFYWIIFKLELIKIVSHHYYFYFTVVKYIIYFFLWCTCIPLLPVSRLIKYCLITRFYLNRRLSTCCDLGSNNFHFKIILRAIEIFYMIRSYKFFLILKSVLSTDLLFSSFVGIFYLIFNILCRNQSKRNIQIFFNIILNSSLILTFSSICVLNC